MSRSRLTRRTRETLILALLGTALVAVGVMTLWLWQSPPWPWLVLAAAAAVFFGWMVWEAKQPPRPNEIATARHPPVRTPRHK